jgi:ribosomal protein S18 acetylase RimI-like enzyme
MALAYRVCERLQYSGDYSGGNTMNNPTGYDELCCVGATPAWYPATHSGKTERRIRMREYEIVDTDADNIGGCGICGRKPGRTEGYRRKRDWLRKRYAEGLRFKVLRSREFGDIGVIEYAPGSHAWRPVEAEGYFVIHCLMVNREHKGKGLGTLLLNSCLRDAKKSKCRGVAVVTSSDSFMAGSDLFIKAGFVSVESIPPYELLVKKFKKAAPDPRFIVDRERVLKRHTKGLTILAADQCPLITKYAEDISQASRALGLKPKVVRITSAKASRELPTPFGVFSIIHNGKLIAERPVSATRFTNIMLKRGTQRGMPIGDRSAQGDSHS